MASSIAENLLTSIQSLYSSVELHEARVVKTKSMMPFTILMELVDAPRSAAMSLSMITEYDTSLFTVINEPNPIEVLYLWCQSAGLYPSISLEDYTGSIQDRYRVMKFILLHVRMHRLAKHKVDPNGAAVDHVLRCISNESRVDSTSNKAHTLLKETTDQDVTMDGFEPRLNEVYPGRYLPNHDGSTFVVNQNINVMVNLLNAEYESRLENLIIRFEATSMCLMWKILNGKKAVDLKYDEVFDDPVIVSVMETYRKVKTPYKYLYLWDYFRSRYFEKAEDEMIPSRLKNAFKSVPTIMNVPDRGGMLEGMNSEAVNKDVRRANANMKSSGHDTLKPQKKCDVDQINNGTKNPRRGRPRRGRQTK